MNNVVRKLNGFLWSKNFKYLRIKYNHGVLGWRYFFISHDSIIIQRDNTIIFKGIFIIDHDWIRIDDIELHVDRLIQIEVI